MSRKVPLKRIARLLTCHQREKTLAGAHYSKAGAALDKVIALGVPMGQPIDMPDGRRVVVRDQFAERNVAFKSASVARYVIEPYRPDKTKLPTRPAQPAVATAPEDEQLP